MNNETALSYNVLVLDRDPDDDNVECISCKYFATLQEAKECSKNLSSHFTIQDLADAAFVEIDGPDFHDTISLQRKARRNDSWRREFAMQAGMMGGCEAYNDVMGGCEPYESNDDMM